jgi:bacillithiol synthase
MITLPFSALPGTSQLFTDYCNNSVEARKYFIGHFTDTLAYQTHLQFLEQRSYFREELATILTSQNKGFRSSEATFANIDKLRQPNTFTVLTGQQVGLYTGPLYTIYKALTTVYLSEWLADQFPLHNFIPVFWMETEDHDLEEANEAGFLSRDNDYKLIQNGEMDPEIKNLFPVGGIELSETINEATAKVQELLLHTDFSDKLFEQVREAYDTDANYGQAFARLFNSLLGDKGVIFVDPSDDALKQFMSPVILREIETFPVTSEEVISRSAELEDHYHAQVKPRAINLFYEHNNKRYPIEPAESDFFLRGSRKRLTKEDLVEAAEQHPELFSPNVLLRPVFQDYLFPTAVYVAGPAEVAYFAQLGPVYDHYQVPMPIIFPRASITIVERKAMNVLEKYNLPFASMFADEDTLLKEILVHSGEDDNSVEEYSTIKTNMEQALRQLFEFAVAIDTNLKGPADSTVSNVRKSLLNFEERLFQSKKQQDEVARRQIGNLLNNLSPGGKPQERMVNILTFYNKYGDAFLEAVSETCAAFPVEHRILLL